MTKESNQESPKSADVDAKEAEGQEVETVLPAGAKAENEEENTSGEETTTLTTHEASTEMEIALAVAESEEEVDSPPWSQTTKVIVIVTAIILVGISIWAFQSILALILIAGIITYLLNPVITKIDKLTFLNRTMTVLLVYLGLAILIIISLIALGVAAFDQIINLITAVPEFIQETVDRFLVFTNQQEPYVLGPISFTPRSIPWGDIGNQILGIIEPAARQSAQIVANVASSSLSVLANIFFIFILSVYFASEVPRLHIYVNQFTELPGLQKDTERLLQKIKFTWDSFLRGQLLLGLFIFFVDWIGLSILGVENALALGILGGLMEFVPTLGALISAFAAVTVAFFQPETIFGLTNFQYAIVVLVFMLAVQQLENSLLVPKIVGDSLDLHPVIILVGVLIGASVGGILGAMLAAPMIASLVILINYAWYKLHDLSPFEHEKERKPPPSPTDQMRTMVGKVRKPSKSKK